MSRIKSQVKMPLLDALRDCTNKPNVPFYAPGHKRGVGISKPLADLLGIAVFRADLPELPELDNLFAPEGVILEAQQLAAEAFGAEFTWFLTNGSTCGIVAAILATCTQGDKIILPRNIHQSAISGLILSGAIPVFVNPEYDADWDIANCITPENLAIALEQNPDAKAVMVLYPTYHGVCGNLEEIAQLTHQYHIPLLVDEAHGAHFNFHPDLPRTALSYGADLTVQSTHKVLGAMTQASILHVQGNYIDISRLNRALQLVQSTSPSYLLLASLDAARQQMALHGEELMTRTLMLAETARSRLAQIPGLSILELLNTPGFVTLDRTRLTVKVSDLELSGFAVDQILNEELGVTAELPMLQHLTFIISLGNTESDIDRLIEAFMTISHRNLSRKKVKRNDNQLEKSPHLPLSPSPHLPLSPSPHLLSPRDAFFATAEVVLVDRACDRISAELICPYPPGIPILMPGEIITPQAVEYLQEVLILGGCITGCSDPTLKTFKVVKD